MQVGGQLTSRQVRKLGNSGIDDWDMQVTHVSNTLPTWLTEPNLITHTLRMKIIRQKTQSDDIISSSLLEQQFTHSTNPPNTPLSVPTDLVMVTSVNRAVFEACVISQQTRIIGHKPMTPTRRLIPGTPS